MSTAELQAIVEKLAISQAETDRQMKATDRKIKELGTLFTGQWGKLVEALMQPGCVKLFRERGVKVTRSCTNQEWFEDDGNKVAEVDVFLINGGEDVAIEVKTTCQPKDIDEHIERLIKIKELRPEYRNGSKKLYGAIAALKYNSEADAYAKRKGFYVLKCKDGIVSIKNEDNFTPQAY